MNWSLRARRGSTVQETQGESLTIQSEIQNLSLAALILADDGVEITVSS